MNSFRKLALSVLLASLVACAQTPAAKTRETELVEVRVSQFHMGMMVDLIVWAPTEKIGSAACAAAFKKIAELNAILSDYEPDSDLSRFCRTSGSGSQGVHAELWNVLEAAQSFAKMTDGRYDVTAAPVIKLWRQARKTGKLPEQNTIGEALTHVGYQKLTLGKGGRAELAQPNMQIDLGSIAKGYIGDKAVEVLRKHGCTRAAFIAGGDMVFGDAPPTKRGWPVLPANPKMKTMELANCACSVSGDTVQFLEVSGRKYSHVIDARTGQALTDHTMCIVVAKSGLISDPLSTIGTIIPEQEFKTIWQQYSPDIQVWVFKSN